MSQEVCVWDGMSFRCLDTYIYSFVYQKTKSTSQTRHRFRGERPIKTGCVDGLRNWRWMSRIRVCVCPFATPTPWETHFIYDIRFSLSITRHNLFIYVCFIHFLTLYFTLLVILDSFNRKLLHMSSICTTLSFLCVITYIVFPIPFVITFFDHILSTKWLKIIIDKKNWSLTFIIFWLIVSHSLLLNLLKNIKVASFKLFVS